MKSFIIILIDKGDIVDRDLLEKIHINFVIGSAVEPDAQAAIFAVVKVEFGIQHSRAAVTLNSSFNTVFISHTVKVNGTTGVICSGNPNTFPEHQFRVFAVDYT